MVYNYIGDSMVTISNDAINEIVIKNSRFICYLYNVESIEEINDNLDYLSRKYKDATHICFAYRFDGKEKYSDDGEPTGTAGAPIMNILVKNNITNVLVAVVRYFGGVKLGAGGLIRAYGKATSEAFKYTTLEEIFFYNYYELEASYDDLKLLNSLTRDLDITRKDFNKDIIYRIKVQEDKDNIEELFKNTNIKIKKLN